MKMFGPKSLSVYLFFLSRLLALGTAVLLIFILLSLVTGNFKLFDGRFAIAIPLLPETFIKGNYEVNILVTISIIFLFYIIFFYLLSMIFKTFKAEILFTKTAIKQLNYFALLNLIAVPFFYVLIRFIIMHKQTYRNPAAVLLHMLLGIFILFIIAVFKRGFTVQSENDLTI